MGYIFKVVNKNDELYHHGILGMKWGKKNGPPYPLSSSAHSASEKKAGWRKSLDKDKKNKDSFSAKAAAHKALAKVYEINEKTYAKSNKTLSSMNKAAKNEQLKKAAKAQEETNKKRKAKQKVDAAIKKKKQERIKERDIKKKNKKEEYEKRIDDRLKSAKDSNQQYSALKYKALRDIEKEQNGAERIIKSWLTDTNSKQANERAVQVRKNLINENRKDIRKNMSTGQKALDTILGGSMEWANKKISNEDLLKEYNKLYKTNNKKKKK